MYGTYIQIRKNTKPRDASRCYCPSSLVVTKLRAKLDVFRPVRAQEEWPSQVVEKPGPEIILSVVNINKASFLGSFRVTVSHEVLRNKQRVCPNSGTKYLVSAIAVCDFCLRDSENSSAFPACSGGGFEYMYGRCISPPCPWLDVFRCQSFTS